MRPRSCYLHRRRTVTLVPPNPLTVGKLLHNPILGSWSTLGTAHLVTHMHPTQHITTYDNTFSFVYDRSVLVNTYAGHCTTHTTLWLPSAHVSRNPRHCTPQHYTSPQGHHTYFHHRRGSSNSCTSSRRMQTPVPVTHTRAHTHKLTPPRTLLTM